MKKSLIVLTILSSLCLLLGACSNEKHQVYAKYIANELQATKWEYTWSRTQQTKGYQIDFFSIKPDQSYSMWLCKGEGAQMYCEMILIRHL